ncbi:HNH endonuclease signature motif containing protein [Streptomyces sp. NPDC087420]|uniref:HNH endonuclease signature motif containing protein n=1 Tax=Streptomyces sp. NPDC087420 TaxID=3365785 RepID=UPI003839B9FA
MPASERDIRRFWSKVALPDEQGCMLWLDSVGKKGYAVFWLNGKRPLVHRVSYELAYSPIPAGLIVDHVKLNGCTNRHCVAPLHLEAVTYAENNRRSDSPSALNGRKTKCCRGHAYDSKNTYNDPAGQRQCRICRAMNQRAYTSRKRSA